MASAAYAWPALQPNMHFRHVSITHVHICVGMGKQQVHHGDTYQLNNPPHSVIPHWFYRDAPKNDVPESLELSLLTRGCFPRHKPKTSLRQEDHDATCVAVAEVKMSCQPICDTHHLLQILPKLKLGPGGGSREPCAVLAIVHRIGIVHWCQTDEQCMPTCQHEKY